MDHDDYQRWTWEFEMGLADEAELEPACSEREPTDAEIDEQDALLRA